VLSPRIISQIGRIGYTAKGVVYGLFGLLALRSAFLGYGKPAGAESTLLVIASQTFGRVLLLAVAVGLLAFVVWRGIQLILDPEGKGSDFAGWLRRAGCGISAIVYLSLGTTAVLGAAGTWGGGSGKRENTERVFQLPGGRFLVIGFGLALAGVGLYHFYRAYKSTFMQSYDLSAMTQAEKTWAERIGWYGLTSRGITFLIIGGFLLQAGFDKDSSKVGGLGDAFNALNRQAFGFVLFAIVAAGFVCYGIYCFSRARYKQFVKHEQR
jgi:hypothetical protein